ncbi:MAG: CPBP family intramembrane glutamic endopeptidase [Clostridiaceae bacterium]
MDCLLIEGPLNKKHDGHAPVAIKPRQIPISLYRRPPMTVLHILTVIFILIGSILPDLLFGVANVFFVKCALLLLGMGICLINKKWRPLWPLPLILLVIQLSFKASELIRNAAWWQPLFGWAGFFSWVAGNVFVKAIGILPVAAALLLVKKSLKPAFLAPGNLKIKADAIPWLGVKGGRVPWGRLSWISGLCIMLGTVILSIVTRIGIKEAPAFSRLFVSLPLILLLAVVNSFCEGLVFRSAILSSLKGNFAKTFALIMPALFFGIAHYEGIPGGILGAVMSAVLGYFISLGMYETEGFLSGWIIHALQDAAIFSTLALLG